MKTPMNLAAWNQIEALRRQFEAPYPTQRNQPYWVPALELQDTNRELILRVELPGVEKKDIDVQVSRQTVAIAGESLPPTPPQSGRWQTEFRYGKFYRSIRLPVAVAHTQAQAQLNNGILTITLPKWQAQEPQVVKVNLTQTNGTTKPQLNHWEAQPLRDKIPAQEVSETAIHSDPIEPTQSSPSMDIDLSEDVWALTV